MTIFDKEYKKLVLKIMDEGIEELNERTGVKTRIVTGYNMAFHASQGFPLLTLRKIPLKLFIAEQIWYLQGDRDLDFFQKYSKIWDDFKETDGNYVESGYGYRWRNFFGRDQIQGLIDMFQKEPSSRQGVVVTWDAETDGLSSPKKKNVPCVPAFIVTIVGGELNLHLFWRSNDVMLGMPHDIAGFSLLQLILAQKLGVKPGWLYYSGVHVHIYENHYEQARMFLEREHEHPEITLELPLMTYERAMDKDETLVDEIYNHILAQYNPLPSLGKMQIAL
jgi:thymidylate synthase